MRELEGLDLLHFDDLLEEEERMARDSVRSWVDERVLPHIEEWAWNCHFPRELATEL